jgi:hypothetical protein
MKSSLFEKELLKELEEDIFKGLEMKTKGKEEGRPPLYMVPTKALISILVSNINSIALPFIAT